MKPTPWSPYRQGHQTPRPRDTRPMVKSSWDHPPTWSLTLLFYFVEIPYPISSSRGTFTVQTHPQHSVTDLESPPTSLRYPWVGVRPVWHGHWRQRSTMSRRCCTRCSYTPCRSRGRDPHRVVQLSSPERVYPGFRDSWHPKRSSFLTSTGVTVTPDDPRRKNGKEVSLFKEDQDSTGINPLTSPSPYH